MNRTRHRGASVIEDGSFYGPGMRIGYGGPSLGGPRTTLVPEYLSQSTTENAEQNITLLQRLDQIVALVREQVNETATIRQELRTLKTEVEEVKTLQVARSATLSSSSSATRPASKKLPKELSVCLLVCSDRISTCLVSNRLQ